MGIPYTLCHHPCVRCKQVDCMCAGGDGRYKHCSRGCNKYEPDPPPKRRTEWEELRDAIQRLKKLAEESGKPVVLMALQQKRPGSGFTRAVREQLKDEVIFVDYMDLVKDSD